MIESLLIVIAYALGSLSSAVIVSRLMGLPDPRREGSGNPGATNVLRLGGKKAAALVFAGDTLKGLIPVVIGKSLVHTPLDIGMIAFAAFLGHLFPVFFGFKGGKGVATALGIWIGVSPLLGVLLLLVWLVTVALFRISSLAAVVSALSAPFLAYWVMHSAQFSITAVLMSALLIWRHRGNLHNLLNGTEPKIGHKHPGNPSA